jgi:hypothetical protein
MHHELRRLVDRDQVLVLVDDLQRNVRRHHVRLDQVRHVADDPVPQVDLVGRARRPPVHRDLPVLDQLLHQRPRIRRNPLVDVDVDPLQRGFLVDLEFVPRQALKIDFDGLGHGAYLTTRLRRRRPLL